MDVDLLQALNAMMGIAHVVAAVTLDDVKLDEWSPPDAEPRTPLNEALCSFVSSFKGKGTFAK